MKRKIENVYLGILELLLLATFEARLLVVLKSFSHSSIVSGSFFPAVSGNTKDNTAATRALTPNMVVGMAT